jgi:hypothetical protein
MTTYKRNQVEEAISLVAEKSAKPSSELLTRIKRLLDTDRTLERNVRSSDPEKAQYAFFSSDGVGSGVEVEFSDYEAFALLTALRLMQHKWPQGFAVATLRRIRTELEGHHARILKIDPKVLFDPHKIRETQPPGPRFGNSDPVLMVIFTPQDQPDAPHSAIVRGMEAAYKYLGQQPFGSFTFLELATPAHQLSVRLSETKPRRRGRAG